jgi:gluconolactonase
VTRTVASALSLALLAAACGDDDDVTDIDAAAGGIDAAPGPDGPPLPDAGPRANPLDGIGAVTLVDEGYQFLEGPTWRAADGVLLFSDIPANTIYQLTPPSAIVSFRNPSGNANGLDSDTSGFLLAAEHGNRRVSLTMGDGTVVDFATEYMSSSLNSPNDIAVRKDGTVYFTDPPYGIDDADRELDFMGVFRVAPGGAITAEWEGALDKRPNGIALSPDETILYVSDTADGLVRAFEVATDGSLGVETAFTTNTPGADGMAVDTDGNLFVTTATGIRVFAPDGSMWGTIAVPRQPANCGFGDADAHTLYITAREGLYRVSMPIAGIP